MNKDEYGGIGLTFSTIFNSDKRRGLKENDGSHGIVMKATNLAAGCSSSYDPTTGSLFKFSPSISSSVRSGSISFSSSIESPTGCSFVFSSIQLR
jgi:hypothetical protein